MSEYLVDQIEASAFTIPTKTPESDGTLGWNRTTIIVVELKAGDEGAVDVLQADVTRCGGVTGFLKVAVLSEAYQLPLSSHFAPTLHLHPACNVPNFRHAEYFYDHVRIEAMLFDGSPHPVSGTLRPDLSRPGLGIEFKRQDAKPYSC